MFAAIASMILWGGFFFGYGYGHVLEKSECFLSFLFFFFFFELHRTNL